MMLTGGALKETLGTNIFTFFSILDATEAVIAEETLRNIKVTDNNILLKSDKTKGNYSELSNYYSNIFKEKGIKTWNTRADRDGLMELKKMVEGARR